MFEIARGLITKELSVALAKEEMKVEGEIEKIFLNSDNNHDHKVNNNKGNNNKGK